MLHNQLRRPGKVLLPTYFQNGAYFNLSLSVYLQVLPTLLFGKSVFVTRAVSALVSLLAAGSGRPDAAGHLQGALLVGGTAAASLDPGVVPALAHGFRDSHVRLVLCGDVLFLLALPLPRPRFLFLAIVMAGLAFYTYSPGQLIVVATWALFLLSDLPYHWKNRRLALPGLGLVLLVASPICASAGVDLRSAGAFAHPGLLLGAAAVAGGEANALLSGICTGAQPRLTGSCPMSTTYRAT